jgi:hypothetical protein
VITIRNELIDELLAGRDRALVMRQDRLLGVPKQALLNWLTAHRLKTPEGWTVYALRKQTPEPMSGIIKPALGFRQFMLRGLDNVRGEWNLVTMAYNVERMFALAGAARDPNGELPRPRSRLWRHNPGHQGDNHAPRADQATEVPSKPPPHPPYRHRQALRPTTQLRQAVRTFLRSARRIYHRKVAAMAPIFDT